MNLRRYKDTDNETLKQMLLAEGIKEDKMMYKSDIVDTFILEDEGIIKGFFSIRINHYLPSLQHFCVKREYRSMALTRELIKLFTIVVRLNGFKKAILHSITSQTEKIIKYFWKVKPYSIKDNRKWYLVKMEGT